MNGEATFKIKTRDMVMYLESLKPRVQFLRDDVYKCTRAYVRITDLTPAQELKVCSYVIQRLRPYVTGVMFRHGFITIVFRPYYWG